METEIAVSDFARLAVLDLKAVAPIRSERVGSRYWAYFKESQARKLLESYENGTLKVIARDYDSAMKRTKDRIFESERNQNK